MNRPLLRNFTAAFILLSAISVNAQKNSSALTITASDLESHVSFLASPLLEGRKNGEEGLEMLPGIWLHRLNLQDSNLLMKPVIFSLIK
ncbi:MAG: hypothetical protein IPN68_10765 [Bacteroidetes bacterium]|nr:hypothetical protein [Bacteroidota bacterium]